MTPEVVSKTITVTLVLSTSSLFFIILSSNKLIVIYQIMLDQMQDNLKILLRNSV